MEPHRVGHHVDLAMPPWITAMPPPPLGGAAAAPELKELLRSARHHLASMPLLGSAAYLCFVWCLFTAMRRRKEVLLPRALLLAYNAGQVLINLYVALAIGAALDGRVWGIGVRDTPAIRHAVWLHFLCKYVDMLDTLIIILRKKRSQLSFLHLWHHASILIVWGWVVGTYDGASATYAYGAWINSCVHVVMCARRTSRARRLPLARRTAALPPLSAIAAGTSTTG